MVLLYVLANNSAIISSPIYMHESAEIKPWILVKCYVSLYINLIVVDLLTGVFIDVLCYKYADFILNI